MEPNQEKRTLRGAINGLRAVVTELQSVILGVPPAGNTLSGATPAVTGTVSELVMQIEELNNQLLKVLQEASRLQ